MVSIKRQENRKLNQQNRFSKFPNWTNLFYFWKPNQYDWFWLVWIICRFFWFCLHLWSFISHISLLTLVHSPFPDDCYFIFRFIKLDLHYNHCFTFSCTCLLFLFLLHAKEVILVYLICECKSLFCEIQILTF